MSRVFSPAQFVPGCASCKFLWHHGAGGDHGASGQGQGVLMSFAK